MSDELGKVADFVRAGQVAQAAVDAIAITALVTAIRQHVGAATAYNAALPCSAHRDAIRRELEAATLELRGLAVALAKHLERRA